jgi:acyl-CoA thioesterase
VSSASPFERLVALEQLAPDRFRAHTDPAWNGTVAPNGGVLAALMARAVQIGFGAPERPVRSISTHYLDRPEPGPVELQVEPLRPGKRVAVYSVRLTQGDRLKVLGTIICSAARPQALTRAAAAPQAPPAASIEPLEPLPGAGLPPVFHQLEMRSVFGGPPLSGARDALAGGWLSLRGDDEPLDAARLIAMCDLWWPAIFPTLRTPDGAPTLQLTVYLRDTGGQARAPVLARYETKTISEGHFEERAELWSSDGRLLAESVQLALLLPLAS